jgi:hypothetical protein
VNSAQSGGGLQIGARGRIAPEHGEDVATEHIKARFVGCQPNRLCEVLERELGGARFFEALDTAQREDTALGMVGELVLLQSSLVGSQQQREVGAGASCGAQLVGGDAVEANVFEGAGERSGEAGKSDDWGEVAELRARPCGDLGRYGLAGDAAYRGESALHHCDRADGEHEVAQSVPVHASKGAARR